MPKIGDTRPGDGKVVLKPRDCFNSNGVSKLQYASKKEAKRAIRRRVGNRTETGKPFQHNAKAYLCHYCGYFHIGHR